MNSYCYVLLLYLHLTMTEGKGQFSDPADKVSKDEWDNLQITTKTFYDTIADI